MLIMWFTESHSYESILENSNLPLGNNIAPPNTKFTAKSLDHPLHSIGNWNGDAIIVLPTGSTTG